MPEETALTEVRTGFVAVKRACFSRRTGHRQRADPTDPQGTELTWSADGAEVGGAGEVGIKGGNLANRALSLKKHEGGIVEVQHAG
jgi:hypothetical protein